MSEGDSWLQEDKVQTQEDSAVSAESATESIMSTKDGDDNSRVNPSFRITQHFFNNDGLNYSDHYYAVEVKVKEITYSVDRSVVDFVELDRKLRKRFHTIKLDPLPFKDGVLESLISALKSLDEITKEKSHGDKNDPDSSFAPTRAESVSSFGESAQRGRSRSSLFGGSGKTVKSIQVVSTDRMDRKVVPLTRYLEGLLRHHELLVADEFFLFFDEEAPSMFLSPASLEPLSIHDLLLLNEPVYKCIVRKKEEATIEVEHGQLVLWKFGTVDFDIAFGVDLNGEAKIKSSRYNSHLKPICGTLLVQNSGRASEVEQAPTASASSTPPRPPKDTSGDSDNQGALGMSSPKPPSKTAYTNKNVVTLTFDNSYARLHTKKLQWSARVVSYSDYIDAKDKALDVMAEKRKFEIQRHSFKRYMIMLAMLLSGVIHSSSVREDFLREEILNKKSQQTQMQSLTNRLEGCEEKLKKSEKARAAAELTAANANDSWSFTTSQLQAAEKKIQKLGAKLEDYKKKCELSEMAAREQAQQSGEREELLQKELTVAVKKTKEKESENDQLTSAMELALRQADETVNTLEAKLNLAYRTIDSLREDMVATGAMEPSAALNGRIEDALERISVSKKSMEEREKRRSEA